MTARTGSLTKIYVSNAAATSAVDTLSEYAALTYIEIGEVTNLGEFGDEASLVNHLSLSDGRVRKLPGPRDAGMLPLVCAFDPLDEGQLALIEYADTTFEYAFKIELADAPSNLYSNSVFYFRGPVTSQKISNGDANSVQTITFNVPINTAIVKQLSYLLT
jgi:hypothetical protein